MDCNVGSRVKGNKWTNVLGHVELVAKWIKEQQIMGQQIIKFTNTPNPNNTMNIHQNQVGHELTYEGTQAIYKIPLPITYCIFFIFSSLFFLLFFLFVFVLNFFFLFS